MWTDPADTQRNIDWTQGLFAAWEPHLARAVYVNDLGDEGEDRARSAYGDNYPRLVALKNKYDPTNLFRLNQLDRLDRFRRSTGQPSEVCAPPEDAGVDPAPTASRASEFAIASAELSHQTLPKIPGQSCPRRAELRSGMGHEPPPRPDDYAGLDRSG